MRVFKRSIGSIVECTFDDHAMNAAVIECTVWGKLVHVDAKQIIIKSWECDKENHADPNNENFAIVKSCIKRFKILR